MSPNEPERTDAQAKAARFRWVMELFRAALELDVAARSAFLAERCDDPDVRAEVERMLAADRLTGSRDALASGAGLELWDAARPTSGGGVRGVPDAASPHALPLLRGDYQVLRVLGEGGMGVVYEAEQAFPRRRVALKAVRTGRASQRMLARFEQEAHILARLSHEGIAQLYEAGASDEQSGDQAFLAMELVDGVPLTTFARERSLSVAERVELLTKVADAVQHAHQRRVIHRDLKPANILVTAEGAPKILDFGVARLAAEDTPLDTDLTAAGQLVGTLPYMSPEQVGGETSAVDARADVYALGVIGYELLTGSLPHRSTGRTLAEMIVAIQTETPRPLRALARDVPRDLEAVCLRALEKDRDRRYQSASELKHELERWLRGEPVEARGTSAGYVLAKQVLRHRLIAALVVLAVAALVAFAVQSRRRANEQELAARALSSALRDANLERGRLLGLTGDLDGAEALLWREDAAHADETTRWALWELYSRHPCVRTLATPSLAFAQWSAPDGRTLVSSGAGSALWTFDLESGSRRDLELGLGTLVPFVEGADAHSAFVLSMDGRVARADVRSGERAWTATVVAGEVPIGLAKSPAGDRVAVVSQAGTLVVLDARDGREIARRIAERGREALTFDRDGRALLVGGEDGVVQVFDAELAGLEREIDLGDATVGALAVAATGEVVAACNDGVLRVVDARTGAARLEVATGAGIATSFELDRAGERALITGTTSVALVSLADGTSAPLCAALRQQLYGARFLANDREIAVGFPGGGLRVFEIDARAGTWRVPIEIAPGAITAIAPSAGWFAIGGLDGAIELSTLPDGALAARIDGPAGRFATLAFDPRARFLAAAQADATLRIYDVARRELASRFEFAGKTLRWARFTSDARWLACTFETPGIAVIDVEKGEHVRSFGDDLPACSRATFAPDGSELASIHTGGRLVIHDPRTGVRKDERAFGKPISTITWFDDGRTIALGRFDGRIELWDRVDGSSRVFEGHTKSVNAIGATANGELFASGSKDGSVRLWSPRSARSLLVLDDDSGEVFTSVFERERRLLWTRHADGSLRRLDLDWYDRHVEGNTPRRP